MRYRAIQEHDRRFPFRLMCRALAVSAAGYYAWRTRPASDRSVDTRTLLSAIRVIHRESRKTYGSPSIWDALIKRGHGVGEHRIARLLRAAGIRAKTVKQWHATTPSSHRMPVAANGLDRPFSITRPKRVWAGDITYVWTTEGWLYLAVVLDLYSRAVIGWALEARLTGDLVRQALTMAIRHRAPKSGLLHHSDRGGSQYAAPPVPAAAHHARHDRQHVETGDLLGPRLCRELLRDAQARAHLPSPVPHARRGDTRHL